MAALESARADPVRPSDLESLLQLARQVTGWPVAALWLDEGSARLEAVAGVSCAGLSAEDVVLPGGELEVHDARADARFAGSRVVRGPLRGAGYAAIGLRSGSERRHAGGLCLVDPAPRTLDPQARRALKVVARQVELLLEHRATRSVLEAAVARLERSEAELNAVLTSMNDGMVMVDGLGQIIWHNPSASRILGLNSGELVGRASTDPRWEVVQEDGTPLPPQELPVMRALATGQPCTGVIGVRAEKATRWIQVSATPLLDRPGAVVTFTDVTDLRAREADLRSALELAQASVKAKSQFLATMSHELRTPMNGVIGMSDLLLAEGPTDEATRRDMLTTIRESGRALLTIIDDVLDYSKIEAGGRVLTPTAIAADEVARSVLRLLEPGATAKGLSVALDAGIAPVPVWADGEALRQVLLNLIGNGIKFTPSGTVSVVVRAAGGTCRIEVRDTGIGIDPEQLPRLFQRFAQADSTTNRRFGGTGLGLAISKKLVEGMGGCIGVEPNARGGSIFYLTLPVPAEEVHLPLERPSPVPARAAAPMRVLLVEDNPINQRVSVGMLGKLGHQVDVASDGRAGAIAALGGHFDLVLMDVHMPVMDGLEATRLIRASEAVGRRLPILALTASALAEDRAACLAAGMDGVVSKPLTLKALAVALGQVALAPRPAGPVPMAPRPSAPAG